MDSIEIPSAAEVLDPGGYAYLQRLLLERTGIVLEPGKEYLVEARLHALMQSEGFRNVSALLAAAMLLASILPAWRAARLDPNAVLRED